MAYSEYVRRAQKEVTTSSEFPFAPFVRMLLLHTDD